MATPAPVGVDKATSLPDINTIISQQEDVLGPLIGIGNDGAQTILTFDTDPPAPANHAVVTADSGGQPATPAGSTQVCRGSLFIAGALTAATASRPN